MLSTINVQISEATNTPAKHIQYYGVLTQSRRPEHDKFPVAGDASIHHVELSGPASVPDHKQRFPYLPMDSDLNRSPNL